MYKLMALSALMSLSAFSYDDFESYRQAGGGADERLERILNTPYSQYLSQKALEHSLKKLKKSVSQMNFNDLLEVIPEREKEKILKSITDQNIPLEDLERVSWVVQDGDEEVTVKLVEHVVLNKEDNTLKESRWVANVYFGLGNTEAMVAMLAGQNYLNVQYLGIGGIEVGYVAVKNLFDSNFDLQIVGGASRYFQKKAGNSINLSAKFVYNTSFQGIRTSFGFSEGQSYAFTHSPEFETDNALGEQAKLMNYITVEAGLNLGDILKNGKYSHCKTGLKIIHRSGIFGTVDAYKNITGGSNYTSLFLECKGGIL